jgi:TetR/AcrR family transcriptional regulator, transcriptional repressor for nem operon
MNKGEITRQRIIEEAAPIFNQRGFAGCSMQDVMEATGLEKGGIYRHFESKEELAAEAFRYAVGEAFRVRRLGADEIENRLERIKYLVRRFVDVPSPLPGGCPLMNAAIDSDDGNPVLRGLAKEAIGEWKKRLCVLVREGMERGEIREGTDSRRISNVVVATLEGALMISRLERNRTAVQDAGVMLEGILDGIALEG